MPLRAKKVRLDGIYYCSLIMNNKRIRRAQLLRRREASFSLSQSINDQIIPAYDALKDIFLNGFFAQPTHLKHLKTTGVIPNNKGFSLRKTKERFLGDGSFAVLPRRNKKSRSETQGHCQGLPQVGQPLIVDQTTTEERQTKTAGSIKYRKFYRSQQLVL